MTKFLYSTSFPPEQIDDRIVAITPDASDTLRRIKRMGYIEHRYPRSMQRPPLVGMIQRGEFIRFVGVPTDEELNALEERAAWEQDFFERLDAERMES